MHRTPNRPPKDNQHNRTPLKGYHNCPPPRREDGSGMKEQWDETPSDDMVNEGKRENARSRRFDLRISNISNIEDKIYGLLSMVKKDKLDQPLPKNPFERAQGRQNISAYLPSRQENTTKDNDDSIRVQTVQSISKHREPLGAYNFNRETKIDTSEHVFKKGYDYTPKNEAKTPTKYDAPTAKVEKQAPKRTYLPMEYEQKTALSSKNKQIRRPLPEQQIQQKKYEIKIERRNEETVGNRRKSIKEEVEQRLKDKQRQNQIQRVQAAKSITKNETIFQNITIHPQKKQQARQPPKRQFSLLHASIPKPETSSFKPITITQESTRSQKLTTTTKLIDQQIKRIRNKIQQSRNHSQWMNSKMDIQEDRGCMSQTYIEEQFDPEV